MTSAGASSLWAIVLAGGEGTRLRPLTRALHGEDLPKQFAMIVEDRSLLQATLERTSLFCPDERTLLVVAREREALARSQLTGHPRLELVLQPRNLGTAAGILLPLCRLVARAPRDQVVIVPSDHFVSDPAPLLATIQQCAQIAAQQRKIVLVGAVAERAEAEYGWIVVGEKQATGGNAVARFVEKPSPELAEHLLGAGGLWNTFLLVAPIRALFEAMARCLPEHAAAFEPYAATLASATAPQVLSRIYELMPPADFSRDVLAHLADLLVVALPPCGWSDWGTPERVLHSLRGSPDFSRLVARTRGAFA